MPTLSEFRTDYYTHTGKASDVSRQLAFAGIAIIWIFRIEGDNPIGIPSDLLYPTMCFVVLLALDLLQYVSSSIIWGVFHRRKEVIMKKNDEDLDQDIDAPCFLNFPALFFFWSKIAAVLLGYFFLLSYMLPLL